MSTPFRLLLPTQLQIEMFAQARAELPNECCGLLAGTVGPGPIGRVVWRYPLTNVAASPVEYLSDGREMFEAQHAMRRRGVDVLAIYHSHPTSDPLPSKTDRERNYSTEVVNFIISMKTGMPVMRGWWLTEEGSSEAEWEIVDK